MLKRRKRKSRRYSAKSSSGAHKVKIAQLSPEATAEIRALHRRGYLHPGVTKTGAVVATKRKIRRKRAR